MRASPHLFLLFPSPLFKGEVGRGFVSQKVKPHPNPPLEKRRRP